MATLTGDLFSTRGRMRRRAYWGYGFFSVILLLAYAPLMFVSIGNVLGQQYVAGYGQTEREHLIGQMLLWGLFAAPWFWISMALMSKRLHDLGHPAYYALLLAVVTAVWTYLTRNAPPARFLYLNMLAQLAAYFYLAFWPGQETANAYGPPPSADDARGRAALP